MDSMEIQPQEINERGDAFGETESRALEDATFQPEAYLEHAEDYRQAESIQGSLESLMAIVTSPETQGSNGEIGAKGDVEIDPQPIFRPSEEVGFKVTSGLEETPLPGSGEEVEFTGMLKEPSSAEEIPLPGTGGEIGAKGQVDIDPDPIWRPSEEVGFTGIVKEPSGAEETPLPNSGEEIGSGLDGKGSSAVEETPLPGAGEEVGFKVSMDGKGSSAVEETPLPSSGEEIGIKFYVKDTSGVEEDPLPGTGGGTESVEAGEDALVGVKPAAIERIVTTTEADVDEMLKSFDLQYLSLQNKIQQQSSYFTLISKVMKAYHDTSKNSINNIR